MATNISVKDSHSKLPGNEDNQAENLFVNRTVSEIRQIEQKARLDIERKKEELRQLVGERYRDMIEAADSVLSMKDAAVKIVNLLATVQNSSRQLQQTHFLKGTGGQQAPPTTSTNQSVSAQIRLVMELQEKIWVYLEKKEHLIAGLSYLIMKHTCSRLRTMDIKWPSVLLQLWQRIASFKDIILKSCHSYLQSLQVQEKNTIECLLVIMLLENCPMGKIFIWFLEDRQVALDNLCHLPSHHVKSIKVTVREIILTLRYSLVLISNLFVSNNGAQSKLLQQLNDITNSSKEYHIPEYLMNNLPDFITAYKPRGYLTTDLDIDCINTNTTKWIEQCLKIVHSGIGQLLSHVTTLKGLAAIRDIVYSLLSEPCASGDDENVKLTFTSLKVEWSEICQNIVGYNINLYDQFLRPVLLDRAKNVIVSQLIEAEGRTSDLLHQLVERQESNIEEFLPDSDMMSFLWLTQDEQKMESDLREIHGREGTLHSLKMKSLSCTPQIYSFCHSFSEQLEYLLKDITSFSNCTKETNSSLVSTSFSRYSQANGEDYPFNWYSDLVNIEAFLLEAITSYIERLLVVVDNVVGPIVTDLKENSSLAHNWAVLDRVLLLARLCQCLLDFTPSLQQIVDSAHQESTTLTTRGWRAAQTSKKPHINLQSKKVAMLLQQKANELFRLWYQHVIVTFAAKFKEYLCSELDTAVLASSTSWEEINITEEAEDGQKISSVISVPSQASVYLTTGLFALCQEISRIGGHNLDRDILQDLARDLFQTLLECYLDFLLKEDNCEVQLSQECSLQMLYDFRFVSAILCPSNLESQLDIKEKCTKLTDYLRSKIDPFDYDVFLPHLSRMLERQLQRSTVMCGVLMSLKGQPIVPVHVRGMPVQGTYQEKHIILPLSNNLPRIPLLPGSSNASSSSQQSAKVSLHLGNQFMDSGSLKMATTLVPSFLNVTATLQHF